MFPPQTHRKNSLKAQYCWLDKSSWLSPVQTLIILPFLQVMQGLVLSGQELPSPLCAVRSNSPVSHQKYCSSPG